MKLSGLSHRDKRGVRRWSIVKSKSAFVKRAVLECERDEERAHNIPRFRRLSRLFAGSFAAMPRMPVRAFWAKLDVSFSPDKASLHPPADQRGVS